MEFSSEENTGGVSASSDDTARDILPSINDLVKNMKRSNELCGKKRKPVQKNKYIEIDETTSKDLDDEDSSMDKSEITQTNNQVPQLEEIMMDREIKKHQKEVKEQDFFIDASFIGLCATIETVEDLVIDDPEECGFGTYLHDQEDVKIAFTHYAKSQKSSLVKVMNDYPWAPLAIAIMGAYTSYRKEKKYRVTDKETSVTAMIEKPIVANI